VESRAESTPKYTGRSVTRGAWAWVRPFAHAAAVLFAERALAVRLRATPPGRLASERPRASSRTGTVTLGWPALLLTVTLPMPTFVCLPLTTANAVTVQAPVRAAVSLQVV